ncbi:hypothetical protein [Flagellimonas zhangzhouensis]|uniref:Uncharacterized protein n=1 Tax=Flagellimonas zhangzhouensis TaxID=1073328 RepID=A0A1H2XPW4_9FLAO|nr:hypothetical protein [Allomuricauda zhangzhouensis]SDQ89895.1 hypothetical protein SAMN05216294_2766 [Allomuricauda zhangzhouensis]SDW94786.1 hypothetical protein SAMN04487892_2760 [Allomuricauda zhangzhouensis]
MRPITFNFLEKPEEIGLDEPILSYDEELNLSIDKNSGLPAFDVLSMDTSTGTKDYVEVSDTDDTLNLSYMDTATRTNTQMESTDLDNNVHYLIQMMDTSTATRTYDEAADSDA